MSRIFVAYSVGGLLGPALGAIGGIRGPFLAYLTFIMAVTPLGLLLLPPDRPIAFHTDRSVLGMRRFWAASAGVLFAYLALGLSDGVLPLHFADGFDQRGLGLLYMAMSVAFAAGAAARHAPQLMVVLSTVLVSVGLGFAATTQAPSYWIVALLVAGVGVGIGTTGSTGVPPRDVPPERIVTAVIVWSEIGIAGYLVGPRVGGAVTQTLGFSALAVIPLVAGAATVGTLAWAGCGRPATPEPGTGVHGTRSPAPVFCYLGDRQNVAQRAGARGLQAGLTIRAGASR